MTVLYSVLCSRKWIDWNSKMRLFVWFHIAIFDLNCQFFGEILLLNYAKSSILFIYVQMQVTTMSLYFIYSWKLTKLTIDIQWDFSVIFNSVSQCVERNLWWIHVLLKHKREEVLLKRRSLSCLLRSLNSMGTSTRSCLPQYKSSVIAKWAAENWDCYTTQCLK